MGGQSKIDSNYKGPPSNSPIVGPLDLWYRHSTYQDITNIGVRFTQTVNQSSKLSCTVTKKRVKHAASNAYYKDLGLNQGIKHTHICILACIRFVAEIFLLQHDCL